MICIERVITWQSCHHPYRRLTLCAEHDAALGGAWQVYWGFRAVAREYRDGEDPPEPLCDRCRSA
jgi:hypothetical protein